jgi:hypothetical protein
MIHIDCASFIHNHPYDMQQYEQCKTSDVMGHEASYSNALSSQHCACKSMTVLNLRALFVVTDSVFLFVDDTPLHSQHPQVRHNSALGTVLIPSTALRIF